MLFFMHNIVREDGDAQETKEWLESLDAVIQRDGISRARYLLGRLRDHGREMAVPIPFNANTPYVNSIPVEQT